VFASILLSSFEVFVFVISFFSMDACQTYGLFKYGDSWLGDAVLGFQWACQDEGYYGGTKSTEWTTKKLPGKEEFNHLKTWRPAFLFMAHTILIMVSQQLSMLTMGVIPLKKNRLLKSKTE